jgi:tetratricopeptide (TPR) repeat protein
LAVLLASAPVCVLGDEHAPQAIAPTEAAATAPMQTAAESKPATTSPAPSTASASTVSATPVTASAPADTSVKSTAIALNYCRASFHRIRQTPTKAVLAQEQEKILNNLNLSCIADSEVIALYTNVLDEINQVGMADYERKLLKQAYVGSVRRNLTWNAIAFSTDLATAQFGSAVRNGANSWWDYRSQTVQHDLDVLKVDKTRMSAVMSKSSQFLDTGWKLAQKKQIPDRWLVRGDDLDALEHAVREPDASVRLRVLKRMGPFMQAYPPYWYYLGRTHQQLGDLDEAIATYDHLVELGDRHFRKDDMLATGLANKSAIQEFLNRPESAATATRALEYSTDVWEANLVCARVLQRHREFANAEDAVLRNLDVGLELPQSRVFLTSVYYYADEREKLVKTLNDPDFASLPTAVLIKCAALLGPEQTPPAVLRRVASSIDAQPQFSFGPDEVVLHASEAWQLPMAKMKATLNGRELSTAHAASVAGGYELRLKGGKDIGSPFNSGPKRLDLKIDLTYPDQTAITLALDLGDRDGRPSTHVTAFRGAAPPVLHLSSVQVDECQVSFADLKKRDSDSHINPDHEPITGGRPAALLLPIEADPTSN